MLLKTSLLVLYLRLFRTDRIMNVLIWTGIATIVVFYSVCIIATSIFCRSSQWPETTNPAEFLLLQAQSDCNGPQLNLASTQGVFSTVSDIYVLVLPIRLIWNLRLSQRRKIGICSILLVGLMFVFSFLFTMIPNLTVVGSATACSIGTMYTRFAQRNSIDFNWDSALNIILGYVNRTFADDAFQSLIVSNTVALSSKSVSFVTACPSVLSSSSERHQLPGRPSGATGTCDTGERMAPPPPSAVMSPSSLRAKTECECSYPRSLARP